MRREQLSMSAIRRRTAELPEAKRKLLEDVENDLDERLYRYGGAIGMDKPHELWWSLREHVVAELLREAENIVEYDRLVAEAARESNAVSAPAPEHPRQVCGRPPSVMDESGFDRYMRNFHDLDERTGRRI